MARLSPNHQKGIWLEKKVTWFLKKLGYTVLHNDYSPSKYPNENPNLIVDHVIEGKALIESTNPCTQISPEVWREKIGYFERKDRDHKLIWILIVSILNVAQHLLDEAKSKGIHVIEIGMVATKTNWDKILNALYHTRLKYLLKSRNKPKPKKRPIFRTFRSFSITSNSNSHSNLVNYLILKYCKHGNLTNNNILNHEEKQDKRVNNSKGILNKGTEP